MRICSICALSSVTLDPEVPALFGVPPGVLAVAADWPPPMIASMASMWLTALSLLILPELCGAAALCSAGLLLAAGSGAGLLAAALGDALLAGALLDDDIVVGDEGALDGELLVIVDDVDDAVDDVDDAAGAELDAGDELDAPFGSEPAAFSKSIKCERNSTSLPLMAGSRAAAVLPEVPTAPGVPVGAAAASAGAASAPMSAVTLALTLSYAARQSALAVISSLKLLIS